MSTVNEVAEIVRAAIVRQVGQYQIMRQAFSAVTSADIESMTERVIADPKIGTRKLPIDVAAYWFAIYCLSARRLKIEADTLTDETVPLVFRLALQCADSINALTLLSRGGLVAEEQLREQAPFIAASAGGKKSREKYDEPREWVRAEWHEHSAAYKNNKSDFARSYIKLVLQKFGVEVTDRTIKEDWLAVDRKVN
jgi:hypothetical protein